MLKRKIKNRRFIARPILFFGFPRPLLLPTFFTSVWQLTLSWLYFCIRVGFFLLFFLLSRLNSPLLRSRHSSLEWVSLNGIHIYFKCKISISPVRLSRFSIFTFHPSIVYELCTYRQMDPDRSDIILHIYFARLLLCGWRHHHKIYVALPFAHRSAWGHEPWVMSFTAYGIRHTAGSFDLAKLIIKIISLICQRRW